MTKRSPFRYFKTIPEIIPLTERSLIKPSSGNSKRIHLNLNKNKSRILP